MVLKKDFPLNFIPISKTYHSDGENFHYIWSDNKCDGSGLAFSNENVKKDYKKRNEKEVSLGVHGTFVAVDWDSCTAQGSCLSVCPVQVFQWYRTEKDIEAIKCNNETFQGIGSIEIDGKLDFTDKAQPIREHNCTVCMACEEICPETAIVITNQNTETKELALKLFKES
tara:strand:+ start:186 stop:695 length:510 start_codon:yes stop_codon:yes gene_type:complete